MWVIPSPPTLADPDRSDTQMALPETLTLRCADGRRLPARLHRAATPRAALLIAPALGVPRRYYEPFAAAMAAAGITTLGFDYRGIAEAQGGAQEDAAIRLQDWGSLDLQAALVALAERAPALPGFLIGHSCGTQLMGLAPASAQLSGMVLVAPSRPHPGHWRGGMRLAVEFMWRVLIPALSWRPRFPARQVGFAAVDAPIGVMRQWARWCLSPRYLFAPEHGFDLSLYRSYRMPALVYDFTDDPFAPRVTVDALLSEMPHLQVTRRRLTPADVGTTAVGHAGFFQRSQADRLWKACADWILAAGGQARVAANAAAGGHHAQG